MPTAVRVAEGNRQKRALPKGEPQFEKGEPDYPPGLSAAGKKIWESRAPELISQGILCLVNRYAFGRLCENEASLAKLLRGMRTMASSIEKEAKAEMERRLGEWREDSGKPRPSMATIMPTGDGMTSLLMRPEGRRLRNTVSDLEALINVQQREFGLTPSSSTRIGAGFDQVSKPRGDSLERALCG